MIDNEGNDDRNGRVNMKSLFDCTMLVADTAQRALEDGAVLRDEIERFVARVDKARVDTATSLSEQASELKKSYPGCGGTGRQQVDSYP
jgi:hypothetical protein